MDQIQVSAEGRVPESPVSVRAEGLSNAQVAPDSATSRTALTSLEAAARVDDPTSVLLTLIEVHTRDESWTEAIARANRLIALHPTDPRYPDLLARLEESAGR